MSATLPSAAVPRPAFQPDERLYPFRSRFLDTPRGRIHYVDEGRGRPLVMVHGNPTWSFLWREVILRLRFRLRCVAIDLPGFGLSSAPPVAPASPREHAATVRAVMEVLDLSDAIVLGHDWGGPIGLAAAAGAPGRVSGLAITNSWCWGPRSLRLVAFSRLLGGPLARLVLDRNLLVERLLPLGARQRLAPEVHRHYRAVQDRRPAREAQLELIRCLRRERPWLQRLRQEVPRRLGDRPLLLAWGMRDPALPSRSSIARWQEAFPRAIVVHLERARHLTPEDAPEELAAGLVSFFDL